MRITEASTATAAMGTAGGSASIGGMAVTMIVALVLLTTGCTATGGGAGTGATAGSRPSPTKAAAPGAREAIGAGLARNGYTFEAGLVRRKQTRLRSLGTPFLTRGQIVQVDDLQPPHPLRFYVGLVGEQAFLLTGDPGAFNRLVGAAGARITDPDAAAQLTRTYLETTRDTAKLGYVVGNVRQIIFRPRLTGRDAARRDQIVARYRSAIAPPRATPAGGGFRVVAYAVKDRELQRHTLTVATDGSLQGQATVLVDDLPAPYTL
jgi:hypothetical protein